ncbi:hypothetical protein WH52_07010 [Tenacibaculum holothuriorum]|uniref:Uncharacterized protein n=1 Tax=Tenacibaculum holothuriorum TaxID=1635173 RepID=A0A1Y2PDI3_9FLAO|nr:polysaccharide biosynthesis C-terminal domain-containing protein [Tenacibaculum holothuriorum]OSY88495.1 hypothetical protein WH52_07010 [Tenacibaculum holothuriorum]
MKGLTNYIQSFLNRSGGEIFIATVLARVFSFIASFIALKLIPNKNLGVVLFSWNIISFLMPFIGFGLHQSYIRYGALLKDKDDKKHLLTYVIKKGFMASLLLSLAVIVFAQLYHFEFEKTSTYLSLFSLVFIPYYLLEIIKIKSRLFHDNKSFAFIEVTYNIILLFSVFILSYNFTEKGYIAALLFTPLITSIFFIKKLDLDFSYSKKLTIINRAFWKFGFFGGLSNVVTMLLFAIDILLIGHLTQNSENVTIYRYLSIIPFSILFLPRVLINTDFVSFTERIKDSTYIKNYIKNYISLFSLISIIYLILFYLFDNFILQFFGSEFLYYKDSFLILNIGVCGILILRGLFGNLLSSIGKVNMNYYISLTALVINIISNYILIPKLGIKGAAITSASLMWFTGIASYVIFKHYYSSFKQS